MWKKLVLRGLPSKYRRLFLPVPEIDKLHKFYLERFENWLLARDLDDVERTEMERDVAFDLMITALGLDIQAR